MSRSEIRALIDTLGDIAIVLANANPQDKAEIYRRLGIQLRFQPDERTVQAQASPTTQPWAYGSCPRGDLNPHAP
jgi:site-specific DNA recombinase